MKMRSLAFLGLLFAAQPLLSPSSALAETVSDAEIVQHMIAGSRAVYKGPCPCPYDTDRRGVACGERSAYSKPGGAEPLCYENDVTPDMIDKYRRSFADAANGQ